MIKKDLTIDWARVKESLLKKERITPRSADTIVKSAENSIKKAEELARPQTLIVRKKILSSGPVSTKLTGSIELSGKSLSLYTDGSRQICLFLVTIGPAIETEASNLMKNREGLAGYMLDRAGSLAVEALAENLEDYVRKEYESKNKSVSMRVSPGYCDWPIEEQIKLDALLDFSKIGVNLTENCMMIPRKSISGLMAIGPKGLFSKARSQCRICKMKSCGYRKA